MSRRRPLSPETPPMSPLPPQPVQIPALWRAVLVVCMLAYFILGAVHISKTPLAPDQVTNYINAPDEAAHLVYVKSMAEKGHMPVRDDPDYPTYEWHQPPLYYSLVSLAHGFGAKSVRCATLLLGLLGVFVIFLTSRRVFPEDPPLAVLAAGFAALLPMRQAVTSAAGNDVLIELMFSAGLLVIARGFHGGFTIPRAITLGVCMGLAMSTKASGILLIPALICSLLLFRLEGESVNNVLRAGALVLFIALLVPAGWYARNWRLYGEVTPVKAFVREFSGTAKAEDFIGKRRFLADAWTGEMREADNITRGQYTILVANWAYRTFWAAYTPPGQAASLGIPFFLPPPFYLLGTLVILPGILGTVLLASRRRLTTSQSRFLVLTFVTLLMVGSSFFGFTWTFFQTQGRYLYPAMLPICLLFAAGFRAAIPEKYRDSASLGALVVMLLMGIAFLVVGVMPAYS